MSVGNKGGGLKKPTAILKLQGTIRNDRHKDRDIDNSGALRFVSKDDFPLPPEDLEVKAVQYWNGAIGEVCHVAGWTGWIDLFLLKHWCNQAVLCDILDQDIKGAARMIEDDKGNEKPNPIFAMRKNELQTFISLCGEFGFSPSKRTAIRLQQPPQEKPQEDTFKL